MGRKPCVSLLRALLFAVVLAVAGAPAQSADPVTETQFRATRAALFSTSPEDGVTGAQALCDYFARQYVASTGRPASVHAEVAPSFEAIESGVRDGSIQFAYVTSMEYLRLQERVEAELVAFTTPVGAARLSRAVVVVPADSTYKSIADLKGRTFARSGRTSTVGYLFPQWLLVSAGLPQMDSFFGKVLDVRADKSAFFAVATGDADCASVDETLLDAVKELSPGIAKRCRVLARSEPIPFGVIVASTHNPSAGMKDVIQVIARGLGADAEGVELAMRLAKIGGLTPVKPGDMDYVKRIWSDVSAAEARFLDPICGKECTPAAAASGDPPWQAVVGSERIQFCSERCLQEFRRHERESRIEGPGRLFIVGVLRPVGLRSNWQDVVESTQKLFEEVTSKTGYRFALEVYTSHAVGRERARHGSLALFNVSASDYPRFHADCGAEAVARPMITESPDCLLLVTKPANSRNGVAGLRGKRIAYSKASDLPTASYLRFLTLGIGVADPDDLFSQTLSVPSDVSAIRAVSMDQADAALVSKSAFTTMSEQCPGVTRGLETLAASTDFVNGPICFLPGLDAGVAVYIRKTLLEMDASAAGKQILRLFGAIRLTAAQDPDYEGIRALLGQVEGK